MLYESVDIRVEFAELFFLGSHYRSLSIVISKTHSALLATCLEKTHSVR